MTCELCGELKQPPGFGEPRKCAFGDNSPTAPFREDNWACGLVDRLRRLCYRCDDADDATWQGELNEWGWRKRDDIGAESIGVLHIPENDKVRSGYVVLTWYKDRGRTYTVRWADTAMTLTRGEIENAAVVLEEIMGEE